MEKDKGNRRCGLDPASVTPRIGGGYPKPFDEPIKGREKRALGNPLGLTQFGVNLTTLHPGAWSSQRDWHEKEDEFVYVLEGEIALVTDARRHTTASRNGRRLPRRQSGRASFDQSQ
jgi:uncharacterized cupin superfamily protein